MLDMASATETGASMNLDWPDGNHSSIATPVDTGEPDTRAWEVEQTLVGARGIERLLADGKAAFAVEVRCLQTAWCQVFVGEVGAANVLTTVEEHTTRGDINLCPGVITLERCELDTDDLHAVLRPDGGKPIDAGPGRWLVLGRPIRVRASDRDAMVSFDEDPNLADGRMRIAVVTTDDTRFQVLLSKQTMQRQIRDEPMLQWACWLAAMAMLPYTEAYKIEERDDGTPHVPDSSLGQALADRLHARGITLWDNPDYWDPAQALTNSGLLEIPAPTDRSHSAEAS
ncbi:MAG TPA: hypothetical protein DEP69_06895 [Acidimicrobiaceae bacterium]|nr:hypothetical protein [Acidimicrobiaceae bacterium]